MEHWAFAIPEILLAILNHLSEDRPALRAAILINSIWHEQGTNILWRNPPVGALAAIPSHDIRQYYAIKVRELNFDNDHQEFHATFKFLGFPGLRRLGNISFWRDHGAKPSLEQYIQPSLEAFVFHGGVLDNVLSPLQTSCSRLRRIDLDPAILHVDVTAERLLSFLKSCKNLTSIEFGGGIYGVQTDDVLIHLLGRQHL